MSKCTKDLQALGGAYPRTCAECGLGPCKRYPRQASQPMTADAMLRSMETDDLLALARGILAKPPHDKGVDAVVNALALQARTSIALIAALAGRSK